MKCITRLNILTLMWLPPTCINWFFPSNNLSFSVQRIRYQFNIALTWRAIHHRLNGIVCLYFSTSSILVMSELIDSIWYNFPSNFRSLPTHTHSSTPGLGCCWSSLVMEPLMKKPPKAETPSHRRRTFVLDYRWIWASFPLWEVKSWLKQISRKLVHVNW